MNITYVNGDATKPVRLKEDSDVFICHITNNLGGWGAGFTGALSARWPEPEMVYRNSWDDGRVALGVIDIVRTEELISVVNMCAQNGYRSASNPVAVDYDYLGECFATLDKFVSEQKGNCELHMPRIGCGLAGGKWDKVLEVMEQSVPKVPIVVYDFP